MSGRLRSDDPYTVRQWLSYLKEKKVEDVGLMKGESSILDVDLFLLLQLLH